MWQSIVVAVAGVVVLVVAVVAVVIAVVLVVGVVVVEVVNGVGLVDIVVVVGVDIIQVCRYGRYCHRRCRCRGCRGCRLCRRCFSECRAALVVVVVAVVVAVLLLMPAKLCKINAKLLRSIVEAGSFTPETKPNLLEAGSKLACSRAKLKQICSKLVRRSWLEDGLSHAKHTQIYSELARGWLADARSTPKST